MENKVIPYEDIKKQFETYLNVINKIPFGFFYDNEEISPDKFAVLFDYLKPTLPLLSYVTMLRTENPDVSAPNRGNFTFFVNKPNLNGLKIIKFNTWVGYYSEMNTSFNEDFVVSTNPLKNYNLMYRYIVRLKNCVRIIDDFFVMFDRPKDYLAPIYQDISERTLIKLTDFFGNYLMEKNDKIRAYPRNAVYVYDPDNERVCNPFVIENHNFPCHADMSAVRGEVGTNYFQAIPQTRFNQAAYWI